jgi:hypothetical protein
MCDREIGRGGVGRRDPPKILITLFWDFLRNYFYFEEILGIDHFFFLHV